MSEEKSGAVVHPKGKEENPELSYPAVRRIETFGGSVEVRWAARTGLMTDAIFHDDP